MGSFTQHRRNLSDTFMTALKAQFGDRCSTTRSMRAHHGHDDSPYPDMLPDAVVFAETVDDVIWVSRHCNEYGVALIPFGAGSSLEGQLLSVEGGVCLDLTRMDQILVVHEGDFTATVQPGVTRDQLNDYLHDTGLFFPIDPGASASLGGMVATRASGTNAVRYGTMRQNVVSLKVVTADGRLVKTASRARKSSAGYDLTRLFVGSEGTLGTIVEVTLRLYPRPESVLAAVCNFPDLEAAVQSVIEIIQIGIPVARVEFMDARSVGLVNQYSHLNLKETPLLLFEFHGTKASAREQAESAEQITHDHGGTDFEWADRAEDRNRLWTARHNAFFAVLQARPGCRASTTDVCVPISGLAECVGETERDLQQASFPYVIVGHVGDGNFHVSMMIDPDCEDEWQESEQLNQRIVERALALDGTCTGEHGVGLHKQAFMLAEYGRDALDIMGALKTALDPNNILNPGKILPQLTASV